MSGFGALLHHREQGDAIKTCKCTEHPHICQDAPGAGTHEEFRDRVDRDYVHLRLGEVQIDGKQTHADGTERYQAQLDPAARHSLAKQRTDAHADRKCSQQRSRNFLASVKNIQRVRRNLQRYD